MQERNRKKKFVRKIVFFAGMIAAVVLAGLFYLESVQAADPESGTLNAEGQAVSWRGFIAFGTETGGSGGCNFEGPDNSCDKFTLFVEAPLSADAQLIEVTLDGFAPNDLDMEIKDEQGFTVASSGNFPGLPEHATFPAKPGRYEVIVIGFAAAAARYNGTATAIMAPLPSQKRQADYIQGGGIQLSPSVTPQAPELPRGGEPSIRSDRDGFVYAGGIRGLTSGGVDLWRWDTKNDPCMQAPVYLGQPIELEETQAGGFGGGDMEIATSQPDNPNDIPVLTVASLLLANVPVAISFDRGETFERHEVGEKVLAGALLTDRHWLTAYGNNTVYLSGRELVSATLSDLWVSTSIDHGRTWSPRDFVQIAAETTPGYLDVDRRPLGSGPGAGNVYHAHQNSQAMFVSVAEPSPIPGISPTGGPLTFKTFTVDNTTGHGHLFDVARVGLDGTVYAVWSDDFNIFLSHSTDQARTWANPVQVNDPTAVDVNGRTVRTNLFPWLVPGDPGRVGIVWFGSNGVNNGDNDGDWAVYYAFTDNALDARPTFRQVQASDHFIHGSNVSEAGLGSGAANNRNLLDFFQVDMDPTGAAVIAFADDHNDFDGQTYVTRQVAGASLLASVGTVPTVVCPPMAFDHNPDRQMGDPEVVDFRNDAQVGRRKTVTIDVPFDITAIDYSDQFSATGDRQLAVTISVSDMTDPPPEGFHWLAFFAANARNDLFDRGQSFFVEASTDPRDGASVIAPIFFYGTSGRRGDGGFTNVRKGQADGGSFDGVNNNVTIVLGLNKINAIAEPDVGVGSRLIGTRGLSFLGSFAVTLPVLGTLTGTDVERDFTRGGIPFVIGSEDRRVALECDDPRITRKGGWHDVKDNRATNGQYCRNVGAKKGSTDAFLEFKFVGNGIDMEIARGPRGGNAEVFIDGVSNGKAEFFRPASDPANPDNSGKKDLTFKQFERFSTTPGEHTFRLEVLNDASEPGESLRDIIYIDRFIIRAGSAQGIAAFVENSALSQGTVAGLATLLTGATASVMASSSTVALTGVLDVPAGSNLNLVLLDPLGGLAAQANTTNPIEVIRYTPATEGVYTFVVTNALDAGSTYELYTITTERVDASSVSIAKKGQPETAYVPEKTYQLYHNYPNPFNPLTHFSYSLPETSPVRIVVYNIAGQQIKVVIDEVQEAGYHTVVWDGRDRSGRFVSSGVYFYEFRAGDHVEKRKVTMLK